MFLNYLKTARRTLIRHKLYSLLNLVGLAVGVACCILILLYVVDELSYDRFHARSEHIYRVVCEFSDDRPLAKTQYHLAPTLRQQVPGVAQAVRLNYIHSPVVQVGETVSKERNGLYADANIFEVFSFELLNGNPATALAGPNSIILTESMAQKYFGDSDPLGKMVTIDHHFDLSVTGVVKDVPAQSHLKFDFILPMTILYENWGEGIDDWETREVYTYLLLPDAHSRQELQAAFAGVIETHLGKGESQKQGYCLQPLEDIYLHSSDITWNLESYSDITYVAIFASLAVLILLIACINFMNLATARSARRAKEIGVRKVVGAMRKQLIRQFLMESTLVAAIAACLAILLVHLALPMLNYLTQKQLDLHLLTEPLYVSGLILLTLLVGFISGSYPALVLSAFQPLQVLKGTIARQVGGELLRKGLVIFQFVVTVVMIVSSITVFKQLHFVRNTNLGFDKSHIVVVSLPEVAVYEPFKRAIAAYSGVKAVSAASHVPPAARDLGLPELSAEGAR